jgi:hypothetical protein
VVFWLGVFLLVAAVVLARQRAAYATADRVRKLKETRAALEARRAELERRIRVGSTAEALLPKVAKVGLGLPSDTATTILTVGSPNTRTR